MSLVCPKCGNRLSRWEVVKFMRLATSYCTRCNSPLSIDKRGRSAIWYPIILSFLLMLVFMRASGKELIFLILLIAGFVAGVFYGDKYGTLRVSSEEDDHQGS